MINESNIYDISIDDISIDELKKNLINDCKDLSDNEYIEIFKIINDDKCIFTQNNYGILINLDIVEINTIKKIFHFINFIKHKKKDLLKQEELLINYLNNNNLNNNLNNNVDNNNTVYNNIYNNVDNNTNNNVDNNADNNADNNTDNNADTNADNNADTNYLVLSSDDDKNNEDLENKLLLKKKKNKYTGIKGKMIKINQQKK